jgi:hypothetical protein
MSRMFQFRVPRVSHENARIYALYGELSGFLRDPARINGRTDGRINAGELASMGSAEPAGPGAPGFGLSSRVID